MKTHSLLMPMVMIALCATVITGCAGVGKRAASGPKSFKTMLSDETPEFVTPRSMVAIWKPSTYEKPGTKSLRGFGGRFYFHNAQNEPVKVDGTLTIYGYDDANGDSSGKADRKFVFQSDTFQQHHSESGIGDSYSFWVPWDEVGGLERTITLIPVFKSADGQIPQSQPATLRLPGKKPKVVASAEESLYGPGTQVISASGVVSQKPMVRQASVIDDRSSVTTAVGVSDLGTEHPTAGRTKTTTLRLPHNLAARLAAGNANTEPSQGSSFQPTSKIQSSPSSMLAKTEAKKEQVDRSAEAKRLRDSRIGLPKREDSSLYSKRAVFGQPGSF
jgi:hypothetical protein